MTRDELIAKLQAASGPSRELDFELCELSDDGIKLSEATGHIPHYTSSIDAAMTLVPKNYAIQIVHCPIPPSSATVIELTRNEKGYVKISKNQRKWVAEAATAALAICIAAVKAMEDQKDD